MVTGIRDNPPLELPSPRQLLAYFFTKFNQLFTLESQTRLGGRDNSGGRVVSPWHKRANFSSNKRFGSPNRNNSRRGECDVKSTFRISSRNPNQKSENSAKPTVIEWRRETQRKRDICTFEGSWTSIQSQLWSTWSMSFTYKRSIKLPRGEGCLG